MALADRGFCTTCQTLDAFNFDTRLTVCLCTVATVSERRHAANLGLAKIAKVLNVEMRCY